MELTDFEKMVIAGAIMEQLMDKHINPLQEWGHERHEAVGTRLEELMNTSRRDSAQPREIFAVLEKVLGIGQTPQPIAHGREDIFDDYSGPNKT